MRAAIWRCSTSAADVVATCLALSLLIAILYNYTTRPIYQATAQILIDRDTPNVLPNKELVDMVQGGPTTIRLSTNCFADGCWPRRW